MRRILIPIILIFFFIAIFPTSANNKSDPKKRLLIIISYHRGYTWSDNIGDSIIDYINSQTKEKIEIKRVYMDSKRNNSEDFKQKAGLKMRSVIESWKPDIIIGVDDNASKYVITPYFLNSNIPFVFCGLNSDPKIYGFPGKNVTGIREITLISSIYNHLKNHAKGQRIGYLTADKHTQRVMAQVNEEQLGKKFEKIYFAKNFAKWKEYFRTIQDEADMLVMVDVCILPGWNKEEAIQFIIENIKIPNAASSILSRPYNVLCISKSANEHGAWAGEAALRILNDTKPTNIPIEINKEGSLAFNLILAEKLNIIFSLSDLRTAETIIDK